MSVWKWIGRKLLGVGKKVAVGTLIAILMELREKIDADTSKEKVLELIDDKIEAVKMDLH